MVRARAVVDFVRQVKPGERGLNKYRVEVWGDDPYDYVRIYTIDAASDTMAAQTGIGQFIDEMERRDERE